MKIKDVLVLTNPITWITGIPLAIGVFFGVATYKVSKSDVFEKTDVILGEILE